MPVLGHDSKRRVGRINLDRVGYDSVIIYAFIGVIRIRRWRKKFMMRLNSFEFGSGTT